MSTSKTYQQSLVDAGSKTRPPMLERGSHIPWASRFRRYLNRKRDNQKWLLKALDEGPYVFKIFTPEGSTIPRLQTAEDLEGDDLLLHDAEIEVMNMILLSIPNEIYNSWEALVSVYNRFAQLMNDLERNNITFPTVTTNTKFLNSLQPEWLKYVTQVRLAKQLTVDLFDDLFYYFQQFEKLVNALRAKKLETLKDDVHNNSEDPLVFAMLLLAKAITQNFSNLTNNRLHASSNTINQAIIQGDRVNIQSKNSGNTGRNGRRAYVQEEVVEGMNALKETGEMFKGLFEFHLQAILQLFNATTAVFGVVPQSSDPSENVIDEAVHKELGDSLVRAATTASSLEAEQDSGQNENVVEEVVDVAQVSTVATIVNLQQQQQFLHNNHRTKRKPCKREAEKRFRKPIVPDELKRVKEKKKQITNKRSNKRQDYEYLPKDRKGYKLKDLKSKGFDSIQEMFDKAFKRVNTFEDFRTELVEGKENRAGEELIQESRKKQKVDDDKETIELKQCLEIIPDEIEVIIDATPLRLLSLHGVLTGRSTKRKVKQFIKIIRAIEKSLMYMILSHMLKSFGKCTFEDLFKMVKARYGSTRPVESMDYLLWNDMKIMFEPHVEDESMQIYMLVEKKYPLTPPTLSMMLERSFKLIMKVKWLISCVN
ncbi:hypothetical protein Tco_0618427 [Tanacetum coccineum]